MTLKPATAARIAAARDATMLDVMRPLATALQTTPADVWRNPPSSSGRRSAPELLHAAIGVHIATPDARGLQLLADLGAEKANRLGHTAWDGDVLEGDELHVGSVVYQVERAARAIDRIWLALWELKS